MNDFLRRLVVDGEEAKARVLEEVVRLELRQRFDLHSLHEPFDIRFSVFFQVEIVSWEDFEEPWKEIIIRKSIREEFWDRKVVELQKLSTSIFDEVLQLDLVPILGEFEAQSLCQILLKYQNLIKLEDFVRKERIEYEKSPLILGHSPPLLF